MNLVSRQISVDLRMPREDDVGLSKVDIFQYIFTLPWLKMI